MKKLVTVEARQPFTLRGYLVRRVYKEQLSTEEIHACISQHAVVTEYLPNGETLILDYTNYNKNNGGEAPKVVKVDQPKEVKKEEVVTEPEEEVVEEEQPKEEKQQPKQGKKNK